MYYEFKNPSGKIILTNLENNCISCSSKCKSESQVVSCELNNKKRRQGIKTSKYGTVYLCSNNENLLNSSRLFKEKLVARLDTLEVLSHAQLQIEERHQKQVKRLVHNLTTLNAHCLQEIYSLAPQEKLAEAKQDQRTQIIEHYINAEVNIAAQAFSRILKNNSLMKVEFSVFNKLYETQPRLDKRSHQIRKVVLNVLHVFFPDFTDKEVEVIVENFEEKINFDYESITVVLMHLIENATKYICPKTKLYIKFYSTAEEVKISFEMISLKINEVEKEHIFEEGFSGKISTSLGWAGKGIGLFLVKQLLTINSGHIVIQINLDPKKAVKQMGVDFESNCFILSLPKS